MVRLLKELNKARGQLYSALNSNKSLMSKDVYLMSVKLDKLIVKYQLKRFGGA